MDKNASVICKFEESLSSLGKSIPFLQVGDFHRAGCDKDLSDIFGEECLSTILQLVAQDSDIKRVR